MFLEFTTDVVRGQIAHIDRNPTNDEENNLAYLCLRHHDEYDTNTSQSKRHQPQELARAKADLEEWVGKKKANLIELGPLSKTDIPAVADLVYPEVFRLRLPIYRALLRFVVSIVREAEVSEEELGTFVRDTHDALFLYGDEIEEYLHQAYVKAIELRALRKRMANPIGTDDSQWEAMVNKETDCILWFNEQLQNGKKLFYPYLKI